MSQRPPLDPLVLGDRSIPMAIPPLATRLSLVSTWTSMIPPKPAGWVEGDDVPEAPVMVQRLLSLAALGLCWEAGKVVPPPWGVRALAGVGYDLFAYGEIVGDAIEALGTIDNRDLLTVTDDLAGMIIRITYPPKAAKVQAVADFSEAEPVQGSSPDSAQPTAGSAIPSGGAN